MKLRIAGSLVLALVAAALPGSANTPRPSADRAVSTSIAYVRTHRADFGLSAADVDEMVLLSASRSQQSGAANVYLRQQIDGLDVLTGDMTVGVLPTGEVFHTGSRFLPGIDLRASGVQRLGAVDAVRAASRQLGLVPNLTLRAIAVEGGADQATLVSSAGISQADIPARLVYHPSGATALRLAWELEIHELSGAHWWNPIIDAQTGRLIKAYDYVISEDARAIADAVARPAGEREPLTVADSEGSGTDGAAYRVYALPLESPNDGDRSLVTNPSDPEFSPYGWHDTNGQAGPEFKSTHGNNVHAFADYVGGAGVETVATMSSDGNLAFDHPLDMSQPPLLWRDAAITNLFYWNNVIHDVFAGYGFDEASGNFQEKNYQSFGLGSDSVGAGGQDMGGVNNASFGTPREGQNPQMNMFLWTATGKRQIRDGDLDAGVVAHEYGHGISIRLTGGPYNVNCMDNQEQGGEGWSDFFGIALTARDGDKASDRRGMGTYVNRQDKRADGGIRPSAYRAFSATPRYDAIKTAAVPHGVGWVWAAALWDVYWRMALKHGFNPDVTGDWTTGGNNLAIQLVIDGLKLQPCRPGFVDARDAIIAADLALTAGENRCDLWGAFAWKGLGYSATQGSSASATDGKQAIDMPPDC